MPRGIRAALLGVILVIGIGARAGIAQLVVNAPDTLPPLPQSGFGIPAATAPLPQTIDGAPVVAPQAPSLRLQTPGYDVTPLQANDPNAPALLIRPSVTLSEALTDNVRSATTNRTSDLETHLAPGLSISTDTPRLQAVLNGGFDVYKYIFAPDQDRELINLYGNGTATVVPGTLFVDTKTSISQGSLTGGLGFVPVAQQPQNQTTQVLTTSFSPYLRRSYDGLVDAELRYTYAAVNSGGTGLTSVFSSQNTNTAAALANSTTNEGTLSFATGRDFARLTSRLTFDATQLASTSLARSTSVTAYDDLQYEVRPNISALGRFGYENIRFPGVSAASTVGPAWQVGGRLDFALDTDYAIIRYGKIQGVRGFSGSLRYEITPATVVTADATQSMGSQQGQILSNLAGSQFNPFTGQILNQFGVPTTIVNPNFALQNQVFRSTTFSVNLSTTIEPNHFSVLGAYDRRTSESTAGAAPSTSIGINFDWGRDLRPNLTGHISAGYTTSSNLTVATLANPTAITTLSNTDTLNGNLSLNYTFNQTLTGSAVYTILYQTGGASITTANTIVVGNILVNRLIFSLTKVF